MKIKIIILLAFIFSYTSFAAEPVFDLTNYKLNYQLDPADYNGFTLLPPVDSMKPSFALALSGGGARGIAQLGVLKVFEENDIAPEYIIGTSIGAFIGGLYSSGYSADDLITIVDTTKWNEIFSLTETKRSEYFYDQKIINDRSLLKLRFRDFKLIVPKSLTSGSNFNTYLQALFLNSLYHSDDDYNNLKYIFRPVATDLVSGKSISFYRGNIINTVRASGTFPLWTLPVEMDSMILVDGGLFENVPTGTAKRFAPDGIISVNTVSPLLKADELNKPWNIADQVVSVMMKSFTDSLRKLADIEIKPDLNGHRNTNFEGMDSLIQLGYKAAQKTLPKILLFRDSIVASKIKNIASTLPAGTYSLEQIKFSAVFDKDFKEKVISQLSGRKINTAGLISAFYKQIAESGKYIQPMYKQENNGILLSAFALPVIKRINVNCNFLSTAELSDSLTKMYSTIPLNRKNFRQIAESVIHYFRTKDYSYAFYRDISFYDGVLTFTVNQGTVSEIKLNPEIKPDSFLVARELIFKENEPVNSKKIIKSYENLVSSELFTNVNIDINKGNDTNFTTNISLEEQGNQLLSLGVLINNERYLQIGLDLVQYNLFNRGLRLNLRAAGGIRNFYSHISLMQQRILNTLFTAEIKGYYYDIKRWVFDRDWSTPSDRFRDTITMNTIEQGFGFKAATGFQLFRLGNVKIEYRYEKQRHHMENEFAGDYYTINTIKFNSVFDSRDNIFFPNNGRFLQLSLETTLFPTKNDVSFSKLLVDFQTNWNFGRNTLRPRIMFGFADKTLPQNEFFNLGGQNMFYGYRENESRGRQLVLGSLEYEYKAPFKLLFDTYFSFRYNLGTTWEYPEEIKFSSLRHGVGMSLGLDTPIGPARFSMGEAFYFRKEPFMLVRGYLHLYFSIGVQI